MNILNYVASIDSITLFFLVCIMPLRSFSFKSLLIVLALIIIKINFLKAQELPRELRGVWIATVLNIDWPSKSGDRPKVQKQEIIQQLDYFKEIGLNAVFFQIRPNANRFYRGSKEPWAEWLSGKQGKNPHYDPLRYIIKACHERGMEFHAWINPYRVLLDSSKTIKNKKNLANKFPEWIIHYGKGTVLNPGLPEVRTYIEKEISLLLQRYEVDGIHYDDYFYPYPYKGQSFPDEATFQKYGAEFENKADWRRHNVDELIKATNNAIINNRPSVKFGVSPFGVWRNIASDSLGSATRAGAPTFDSLYTNTRKWLQKGWVDYIAPQLYWSIGFAPADYSVLAEWWAENAYNRHIYIGHAAYKINNNYDSAWYNASEIPNQIRLNRQLRENVKGSIYFSAKQLIKNPNNVADSLKQDFYSKKALPPLLPWKPQQKAIQPTNLKIKVKKGNLSLKWLQPKKKLGLVIPSFYAICVVQNQEYEIIKILDANKKRAFINIQYQNSKIKVMGLNTHFN